MSTTSDYFHNKGKTGPEARKKADRAFRTASVRVELIQDVSAELARRELVGRRLQEPETIRWRQRVQPHSLHLTWIGDRLKGREVVYVEGANNGKMLVRLEGWKGLLRILKLDPTGSAVKWGSRYPVTSLGYDALVRRIVENYDKAKQRGRLGVVDFGLQNLSDRQTHAFQTVLDYPESQSGDYHKMIVWFDVESGFPVRFIGLNINNCLLEDYHWQQLQINQNLTDADFIIGSARQEPEPEPTPTPELEPTPEAKPEPEPAAQPEAPKVTDSPLGEVESK